MLWVQILRFRLSSTRTRVLSLFMSSKTQILQYNNTHSEFTFAKNATSMQHHHPGSSFSKISIFSELKYRLQKKEIPVKVWTGASDSGFIEGIKGKEKSLPASSRSTYHSHNYLKGSTSSMSRAVVRERRSRKEHLIAALWWNQTSCKLKQIKCQ